MSDLAVWGCWLTAARASFPFSRTPTSTNRRPSFTLPASGSARVTIPSTISTSLRPVACAFTSSTRFLSSAGPVRCPDGPRKPWRASRSSSPRSSEERASSWRCPSSVVLTVMPLSTAACSPIRAANTPPTTSTASAADPARRGRLARQPDRLGRHPIGGGLLDVAVRRHLPEHVALAGLGGVRVLARREALRALGQPRQQRRLGQVDVAHRLSEEVARGLLAAVAAVAVVDLIEVERQHLFLRQLLRQLPRQDDLLHLAAHRPLRREDQVLHHLLRDRRAPLRAPPAQHVLEERAHHAAVVEPAVLEVVGVLGRDDGVDEQLGDRVVGDDRPLLAAELADRRAVAIEDARQLLRAIGVEPRQVGELRIAAVVAEETDHPGDRGEQPQRGDGRADPQRAFPGRAVAAPPAAPERARLWLQRPALARGAARIAIVERGAGRHPGQSIPRRGRFKKPLPRAPK